MSTRYRILGPIEVSVGGRVVDPGPPKQRALLAALLVNANRVVSLDRLIDDLWSAGPPPAATASLQAYIANLRRILEPDRPARAPSQVLVTRAPGYLLHVDTADLDITRFEQLGVAGRGMLDAEQPARALAVLGEALTLWRGEPLAELSDYEFAVPETVRLGELHAVLREQHAEAALAVGDPQGAIVGLERLHAAAPLRERACELLALALYRSGRQADALAVLHRTRTLLRDELGIDPGPALRTLHAAILRQQPDLQGPPAARPRTPAVGPPDPTPQHAEPDERPLVGRDRPLAVLRSALEDARAGRGGVVLVAGEPGIGKTRIVEAIAAEAVARGVDVVWGRCHETADAPPFWPWRQMLRGLSEARPDQIAVAAADPALGPLAAELPAPAGAGPDAGADRPLEHSRFLVCDAATRLALALAARAPLVLVCEDLHWADAPSLELLAYLAGQAHTAPLLLVGTFRDTEVDDGLRAALAALAREPRCARLRLTGLAPEDIVELAARSGWTDDDPTDLHELTGGNPFFATELIKLRASESRGTDRAELPVPDSVADVLRRRIARLPEQAVVVLAVAAVIGPECAAQVLERVSGLDEDQVLGCVEAAVATGLLQECADVGRYRFVHALVRDTIYRGLSGLRRARLHGRIAEAVRELYGTTCPDALAHHLWQAGPAVPAERALEPVLAAAGAAEEALAVERAVELLERAVTLLGRMPPTTDTELRELDVQYRLARLRVQAAGYADPRVDAAFDRAGELAHRHGRTGDLAAALRGRYAVRIVVGDLPGARALTAELVALAERTGAPGLHRSGRLMQGMVAWYEGRIHAADEHLAAVLSGADERDRRVSLIVDHTTFAALGFRGAARGLLGDDAAAVELCDRALTTAGSPYLRTFALVQAMSLAVYARDPVLTRRWAAEAGTLATRYGFAVWLHLAQAGDAWACAVQGETGADRLRQAHQGLQRRGVGMMRHFVLGLLAEAELAEGLADDARRTLAAALAASDASGEAFYRPALMRLHERLPQARLALAAS